MAFYQLGNHTKVMFMSISFYTQQWAIRHLLLFVLSSSPVFFFNHHSCERTKSKQKQNQFMSHSIWPCVLLLDLAHKQCNDFIKGWLHCLTSESKGRFLANNILIFDSSWCLVMAQIQFSLIKKMKKDCTSRTLATPTPCCSMQELLLLQID